MTLSSFQLSAEVPVALAAIFDVPRREVKAQRVSDVALVVRAVGHVFVVDVLANSSPAAIAARVGPLVAAARQREATAVIATPFMTEGGRRACAEAKLSWFDLSGNARIVAPMLRVVIDGRTNRFRVQPRPTNVAARNRACVVRWLLTSETRSFMPAWAATATGLPKTAVKKVAGRLAEEEHLVRGNEDEYRVTNPVLLADAWRDDDRFDRHTIIRGTVAARSGDALTRFVSDTFASAGFKHAATGLSAAWLHSYFAGFRIATVYVAEPPDEELRAKLGFRDDPRGENLWLVVPDDESVLQHIDFVGSVSCVHPTQAYVDLKGHPERAPEAAERLRGLLVERHRVWRREGLRELTRLTQEFGGYDRELGTDQEPTE